MKTVCNGLNINYEIYEPNGGCLPENSDTLVLLLHGWGCRGSYYRVVTDTCALKYKTVAPDLPGHGDSDEPDNPWSLNDFVDFTVSFLKNFEFKKLILIGHSNGGRIIIRLLVEKKLTCSVEKVILIDSAGIRNKLPLKKRIRQRVYKLGRGFYNFGPVKKLSPDGLEKWKKKFGSADYSSATPVMRDTMVKLINEDLTACLPLIEAETLLIWGENDTATPLSDGQTMEKMIKGSGLVTVKGAGHFSYIDQPGLVSRVIASFLKIG